MRYPDIREEFIAIGIRPAIASSLVPYAWFSPATTAGFGRGSYEPMVIMMMNGIQNGLRRLGVKTRGDGFMDRATDMALVKISGPQWKNKAWFTLISEVNMAKSNSHMGAGRALAPPGGHSALGGVFDFLREMGEKRQPLFRVVGSVCKPVSRTTLLQFQKMQEQINRVAQSMGVSKIRVDGEIGSGTLSKLKQVWPAGILNAPSVCKVASENVVGITAALKGVADKAGVPAKVPGPALLKPPTFADPETGQPKTAGEGMPWWSFPAIGAGLAVIYSLTKKKKKSAASYF
jgi:hypothetical protein